MRGGVIVGSMTLRLAIERGEPWWWKKGKIEGEFGNVKEYFGGYNTSVTKALKVGRLLDAGY